MDIDSIITTIHVQVSKTSQTKTSVVWRGRPLQEEEGLINSLYQAYAKGMQLRGSATSDCVGPYITYTLTHHI